MKKRLLMAAALAALTPLMASAASVDLTVTGTVVPTSCVPSFTGGSNVDLGRIHSAALSPTAQNDLPRRNVSLRIACTAPAAVAIRVSDNRFATKVSGLTFIGHTNNNHYYGLGSTQGVGIGGFGLIAGRPTANAYPRTLLVRTSGGGWEVPFVGMVANSLLYSWGDSASQGPFAASQHIFPMQLAAVIRPTSQLPATTEDYKLDGSVTFDMVYL